MHHFYGTGGMFFFCTKFQNHVFNNPFPIKKTEVSKTQDVPEKKLCTGVYMYLHCFDLEK